MDITWLFWGIIPGSRTMCDRERDVIEGEEASNDENTDEV